MAVRLEIEVAKCSPLVDFFEYGTAMSDLSKYDAFLDMHGKTLHDLLISREPKELDSFGVRGLQAVSIEF